MSRQHPDGAISTVASYNIGSGLITVAAGDGPKFGSPTPENPLRLLVAPIGKLDADGVFLCTGRNNDVLNGVIEDDAFADHSIQVNWRIVGGSWCSDDIADLAALAQTQRVPAGSGTPGQVLTKTGNNDDDYAWEDAPEGGGGGGGSGITALHGDGSAGGTGDVALTLATVNSNVGTFQGLTVDAKGRVTAAANQNYATSSALTAHTSNTSNPHGVTKAQVGLGSVDNTSDAAKPISTATQTALNLKQAAIATGSTSQYLKGDLSLGTFAADVAANLPTTGYTLNQYKSVTKTDLPTSGAITLNPAAATNQEVTLTGAATITLTGGAPGAMVNLRTIQDGTGGRVVTWGGTGVNAIYWLGGEPNPSTTAGSTVEYVIRWSPAKNKWTGAAAGDLVAAGGGSGTVTSVGLGLPTDVWMNPSAVTTSGTLSPTLKTQVKNTVWAGPATGSDAAPSFRVMVGADVPSTGLTPTAWKVPRGAASGATPALDFAANNKWGVTVGADAAPTFSGAAAGVAAEIMIDSGGAYAWTWPGGVTLTWFGDALPGTLAAKKYKVYLYFTSSSAAEAHYMGSTA